MNSFHSVSRITASAPPAAACDESQYVTDGGSTWGPNVQLNDPGLGGGWGPRIAIDRGNTAYAIWGGIAIGASPSLVSSTDGGITWSASRSLSTLGAGIQDLAITALAAGDLLLAWEGLYFTRSTDGGTTWSPSVRVAVGASHSHAITADDAGNVYLAWEDGRNGNFYDIYSAASFDGGQTWNAPIRVSQDIDPGTDYHQFPSIAVDARGTVYVGWAGWGQSFATRGVFLARSRDKGATWETNLRVDRGADRARKYAPAMTVDPDGSVLMVWEDDRSGNGDIYFGTGERGSGNGGPFPSWLLAAIILSTVAAILLVVVWRRRRKKAPRGPENPPR